MLSTLTTNEKKKQEITFVINFFIYTLGQVKKVSLYSIYSCLKHINNIVVILYIYFFFIMWLAHLFVRGKFKTTTAYLLFPSSIFFNTIEGYVYKVHIYLKLL